MALPKLATAKYELTLPSTGEKVEYRPFLVKEEKTLLMMQETENDEQQLNAIISLVENCTFGKLDIKNLPMFDVEYLFIQIRAKSVGEKVKLNLLCPDDNETRDEVEINLNDVKVQRTEGHDPKVQLTDTVGMIMTYPKLKSLTGLSTNSEGELAFTMIRESISQIYDADNVYAKADMDDKELDEFIDSMNHSQFEKLNTFFETMPKLKHTVKVKNKNTGVESDVTLEGMNSFFV